MFKWPALYYKNAINILTFWRRKQILMPPKGITKIAVFLDFKITICVASETDVLFTRKMYVKARTICLYGLLNVKSVIEVMEEQIVKKTMCIFVRGYKETYSPS